MKKPPPIQTPPPRAEKKKEQKKEEEIPKWKLQSAAFRAGLKQGRGGTLTAEEKQMTDQASNMVQCSFCGRKFNAEAAKRHIPFC